MLVRTYIDDDECSIAEIAALAEACTGTIAREFRRLENARVLTSRIVGGATLVRANHKAPFYQALRDLVVIVLGPAEVIGEEGRARRVPVRTAAGSQPRLLTGEPERG